MTEPDASAALRNAVERLMASNGARGRYHALENADAQQAVEDALIAVGETNAEVPWHGSRPESVCEAIAKHWAEWEEDRAGTGTYTAEELAEDAGEFATGLFDALAALATRADDRPEVERLRERVATRERALRSNEIREDATVIVGLDDLASILTAQDMSAELRVLARIDDVPSRGSFLNQVADEVTRLAALAGSGKGTEALAHPPAAMEGWRENVEFLLNACPHTIRSCEGGGAENLIQSLVLTFKAMQHRLATPDNGSAAVAVPAGWRLVPVEPTEAMFKAVGWPWKGNMFPSQVESELRRAWSAMVAASPVQPAGEVDLASAVLTMWHDRGLWGDNASPTRIAGAFSELADKARLLAAAPDPSGAGEVGR